VQSQSKPKIGGDIPLVSHEQGKGIRHIKNALTPTKSVLERNADLAHVLAESGKDLQESMNTLRQLVVSFRNI
jgi:methyl-accepting chemotaxis protein